jgi:alkylation response protein AidB-like acyl-CoA dehydrogenase
MEIIEELAEMGVFGLTIPEEYGGFGLSKVSMASCRKSCRAAISGSVRSAPGPRSRQS